MIEAEAVGGVLGDLLLGEDAITIDLFARILNGVLDEPKFNLLVERLHATRE